MDLTSPFFGFDSDSESNIEAAVEPEPLEYETAGETDAGVVNMLMLLNMINRINRPSKANI